MNLLPRILHSIGFKKLQLPVILTLFFLASCVTQKDIEYLQDSNNSVRDFTEAKVDDYRLKPNDELYIQISSLDDASAGIFSSSSVEQYMYVGTMQPYGASLMSYSVDREGKLNLPVIGSLTVLDMTLTQVGNMLKDTLKNILSQPVVSVKLVNRYVSVLGEVRNPGHFPYAQDKLSIFEAIGLAGDITEYGNRKEVLVIRNENGKNQRINISLIQSDILSSNYYYLRPNDIVYIKPLRNKFWSLREFPYTIVLSTLTTAVLMYSVFR